MHLSLDLGYYISLLRRRILYILIPFVLVLVSGVGVATLLPSVYRATGTILVESQQIPDVLVRSTVSSFAGERIGIIKQRVMTRTNLLRIAEKFGLLADKRQTMTETQVVGAIQDAIAVEPETVSASNRLGKSMIAFTVSFDHGNPAIAVAVANELISLLLQENVRARTVRAAETTNFLKQEAGKLKTQIDAIDGRLATYKEKYGDALPEHLDVNIQALERAKSSLRETNQDIKTVQAERRYLDIQLMAARSGIALGPNAAQNQRLTPEQELERMKVELLEKTAVYDDSHPDVIALKRKVSTLSRQYRAEADRKGLEHRLQELDTELKDTKGRYSEKHPDSKRLASEISNVRKKLADLPPPSAMTTVISEYGLADPISANVQAQIEIANGRMTSLEAQRQFLEKRIQDLESIVARTPEVERGLKVMNRDYQNAIKKYEEIKAKEMEAQLAESLEEDRKAERFSLLEPPVRPDNPIKPNRLKIIAVALALALAAGGGGLLFIESIDGSIRGIAGYKVMLRQSPLAAIPYIATAKELRLRRQLVVGTLCLMIVAFVASLAAVHIYYRPLDALVNKAVESRI